MTLPEQLLGILVFACFVGVVGCFVAPFLSARCWSNVNKRVLLGRNVLARRALEELWP